MRLLSRLLRSVFALTGAAGVALHATVRDTIPGISAFFYALPLPVDAALLSGAALLGFRDRKWTIACLLAAAGVAGCWIAATYGTTPESDGDIRVATWNIGRPRHPFPPLADLVRREQPDFLALVEAGGLNAETAREYARVLPGYHCTVFAGGLASLSRSPVRSASRHSIPGGGQVVLVETTIRGAPLRIFLVDLNADVLLDRAEEFTALADLAGNRPRTILLGDFNTPLESVHSDRLRPAFLNAMEVSGKGFRESWFYMLPLLSLDQIWTSPDLPPVSSWRAFTLASDHAPVITNLRVAPSPGRNAP